MPAIGAGLIPSGAVAGSTDSTLSFIATGAGLAAGLALLIAAGLKYNR